MTDYPFRWSNEVVASEAVVDILASNPDFARPIYLRCRQQEFKVTSQQEYFERIRPLQPLENELQTIESEFITEVICDFRQCTILSSIDRLAQFLKGKPLSTLKLIFESCSALRNVDEVWRSLKDMPLTSLWLDFHWTTVAYIGALGCSLKGMPLTKLTLSFLDCKNLSNIDELGRSLQGMPLTSLSLDFRGTSVAKIDDLGRSLSGMADIPDFKLQLGDTRVPAKFQNFFNSHSAFKKAFG